MRKGPMVKIRAGTMCLSTLSRRRSLLVQHQARVLPLHVPLRGASSARSLAQELRPAASHSKQGAVSSQGFLFLGIHNVFSILFQSQALLLGTPLPYLGYPQ